MLETLAISNYRSILNPVLPMGQLNVVTGPNGSGKSNLCKTGVKTGVRTQFSLILAKTVF